MTAPAPASLAARAAEVAERIAAAARRSGRPAGSVRLVAVTKGVPAETVRRALPVLAGPGGVPALGESQAQELLAKAPSVGAGAEWHFIGRLQRNKVAALSPLVGLWQSVDRLELGAEIARRAPGAAVLVQVNTSDEPQKGGCRPDEAGRLRDELAALGLDVRGLMTVPAAAGDPRPAFAALADLGGRLGLAELSMGMSADFEVAVEEGATLVRVGQGLFGPRIPASHLQR